MLDKNPEYWTLFLKSRKVLKYFEREKYPLEVQLITMGVLLNHYTELKLNNLHWFILFCKIMMANADIRE